VAPKRVVFAAGSHGALLPQSLQDGFIKHDTITISYTHTHIELSQELDNTNSNACSSASSLWADVKDMLLVDFLLPHNNSGTVRHCQPEALAFCLTPLSTFLQCFWRIMFECVLEPWVQRHVELRRRYDLSHRSWSLALIEPTRGLRKNGPKHLLSRGL